MINYQILKLEDVAKWERSKEGVIYPKGSTLIQLSATKGGTDYLKEDGEVDRKYAVVIPNKEINPRYLNIVIERNIQYFVSKYQAGLNIQINDLKHLDIQLHDRQIQDEIAIYTERIEKQMEDEGRRAEVYTTIKKIFLKDMMI